MTAHSKIFNTCDQPGSMKGRLVTFSPTDNLVATHPPVEGRVVPNAVQEGRRHGCVDHDRCVLVAGRHQV